MLRSHRKITEVQAYEVDLANDSGLRQKSTFQLLSTQAGHRANVGFTEVDVRNYITARRKRSMAYGEIGCLSKYFQRQLLENPSFFHAYQMDVEEHITNVFWCDAQMILDYGYFGDVVSLDTTYCTNYANRPLAFFSGFNHYRGSVIFGAALMYDETSESFRWLFDTFLQAHNNKKPKMIFTDQDQAMARAVADVMPETHHGLCTWHLLQNGVKHLGNMMKGGSSLLSDIKKCMYDIDIEADFEKLWFDMIHKFNIHDKSWIISTYELKKKWASCYMKGVLTLGMRSTQVSESLNAHFKSCMKPNVNILEFFNHFEIVVEEKRAKELSCVYESSHKLARHESDSLCEYVITKAKHEGSWRVSFNRVSNSITCGQEKPVMALCKILRERRLKEILTCLEIECSDKLSLSSLKRQLKHHLRKNGSSFLIMV
ncbi:protein FAR1-RELATED SEQUENCE 5-like [Medicago truncatula]|uniref:protein FAR1-RELATED SEQUENCE 5-like n=1 Tax=Medicago truncatula TaxID=3880 RepID=UPI0019680655|nr:protein FAR1-RELATED SEQUENCE 5-like [Medicago truncatula]